MARDVERPRAIALNPTVLAQVPNDPATRLLRATVTGDHWRARTDGHRDGAQSPVLVTPNSSTRRSMS